MEEKKSLKLTINGKSIEQRLSVYSEEIKEKRVELYEKRSMVLRVYLFVLGMHTNFAWFIIGSSAQDIANHFGYGSMVLALQLSMTFLGVVSLFFNSKFFLKVRHRVKITIICSVFFIAYTLNYTSFMVSDKTLGFSLSCLSALLIGGAAIVSDVTCLGFLKAFPSESVGSYSSGTGFSGLFGISISLSMDYFGIEYKYISALEALFTMVYFFMFIGVIERCNEIQKKTKMELDDEEEQEDIEIENEEAQVNLNFTVENFKSSVLPLGKIVFNVSLVFFLDYLIISSLVERTTAPLINSKKFIEKYAYKILYLGYMIGTFLARSSVNYIKVPKIQFLSYFQIINFLIYCSIAYYKWLTIWVQIPICFFVGLLGGASFCNCFYLILDSKKLKKLNRELCVNYSNFFMYLSVIFSSLLGLVVSNYIIVN